jgi:hypothetical protein
MAAARAIVSGGSEIPLWDIKQSEDVSRLSALAAWRTSKGIYRFDATLYEALRGTAVEGEIPCEVLRRLPEWCVYVETPGLAWGGRPTLGFFAHLEWDAAAGGREELRLAIDYGDDLMPIQLHLGPWTIEEAIRRTVSTTKRHAEESGFFLPINDDEAVSNLRGKIEHILSLTLYICSQASDLSPDGRRPARPRAVQTKRGPRLFPPDRTAIWEVGIRIGEALRRAYAAEAAAGGRSDGTHASPRGHIRRAHWHTFRTGPRKCDGADIPAAERAAVLRWLPPIPVNIDSIESLPATIHNVE